MTEDYQNLTPCAVRDGEPVRMLLRKQDHRGMGKEGMGEHRTPSWRREGSQLGVTGLSKAGETLLISH